MKLSVSISGKKDFRLLLRVFPFIKDQRVKIILCFLFLIGMSLCQFFEPVLLKEAIDHGLTDFDALIFYSGIFFVVMTLESSFRMAELRITYSVVGEIIFRMRRALVEKLLFLPASFHDHHPSGVLVSRATNDFDGLAESLNEGLMESTVDILMLISCLCGLFYLDWRLGLMTLILTPFLWALMSFFSFMIRKSLSEAKKSLAKLHGFAQECLFGIDSLKSLSGEKHGNQKFFQYSEEFRKYQTSYLIYDAIFYSVIEGLAAIFMGGVLFYIGKDFFSMGHSIGLMIGILRYGQKFFEPIKKIGSTLSLLQGAFTSLERIFEILDQPIPSNGTLKPSFDHLYLEAKNVNFSYDGKRNVFQNVTFSLAKGESLALVGKTGAGKTSFTSILLKIYSGYEGSLTLNGVEVRDLDPLYLREHIGVVSQNVTLFPGSLRFNLSLNRPQVTEEKILKALDHTGAKDFVFSLPGGLDYMIKDHGSHLSQGEKQLLLFVRALATDPALLILDEASASLDEDTEQMVQKSLDKIRDHLPILVIAHRKKTIEWCHKIYSF